MGVAGWLERGCGVWGVLGCWWGVGVLGAVEGGGDGRLWGMPRTCIVAMRRRII